MFTLDFESLRLLVLGADCLLFLLVAMVALFVLFARRRAYYRAAWRQIRSRSLPMVCMGICLLYLTIALLDSVHFYPRARSESGDREISVRGAPVYDTQVQTLLDVLCMSLGREKEKTFSAPFACRQFVKETIQLPDGRTVRDYPRLVHAGRGLGETENRGEHITGLALRGLAVGAGVGALLLLLSLGLSAGIARLSASADRGQALRRGRNTGLFLGVTALVVSVLAMLSTQYHVLGTDQVGQDILYRAMKGARVGLIVGTLTTLIATPLAILFGISAGYFGGRIDDVIQYIYTTIYSIPNILLIAAAMLIVTAMLSDANSVVASDSRLLWLCVVLGIGSWTTLCRLLRAETLKVKQYDYVQAAEAFGGGPVRIMSRHILPNVMHIVLITVVLRFSELVLAEAVLAYVGIGVDPAMESWGNMINAARLDISRDPPVWWNLLAAFLFMLGLVLPANIFGDAVRDALDPRLKTQ